MSSSLKRTVTYPPKKSYKKTRSVPKKLPLGLQRYLDVRGTPAGTYELVRTVTGNFDYSSLGFTIGATQYLAGTFVFSPTTVVLYSGVAGNQITWNIVNSAEIAALWDKVKIDKVECMFTTSGVGAANSTVQQPILLFAEDDNDSATSPDQIKQMDCKPWNPGDQNNKFLLTVRPRYQRLVYYTSLLSSYEPTRGYVVSGTDIPHYGLKMGMDPVGGIGRLSFSFKIFFKCKELK